MATQLRAFLDLGIKDEAYPTNVGFNRLNRINENHRIENLGYA